LEGELLICQADRTYKDEMTDFDNGISVVKIPNWNTKGVEKGLFPFKNDRF